MYPLICKIYVNILAVFSFCSLIFSSSCLHSFFATTSLQLIFKLNFPELDWFLFLVLVPPTHGVWHSWIGWDSLLMLICFFLFFSYWFFLLLVIVSVENIVGIVVSFVLLVVFVVVVLFSLSHRQKHLEFNCGKEGIVMISTDHRPAKQQE